MSIAAAEEMPTGIGAQYDLDAKPDLSSEGCHHTLLESVGDSTVPHKISNQAPLPWRFQDLMNSLLGHAIAAAGEDDTNPRQIPASATAQRSATRPKQRRAPKHKQRRGLSGANSDDSKSTSSRQSWEDDVLDKMIDVPERQFRCPLSKPEVPLFRCGKRQTFTIDQLKPVSVSPTDDLCRLLMVL